MISSAMILFDMDDADREAVDDSLGEFDWKTNFKPVYSPARRLGGFLPEGSEHDV